ncbi:MAG: DUF3299 domain-containing protein [Planctomycetota bacterium]
MLDRSDLVSLIALSALVAGCGGGSPERVDGGSTVETGVGATGESFDSGQANLVRGASFTEPPPLDDGQLSTAEMAAPVAGGGLPADVSVGNVNPAIAAMLRADPGQTAAGTIDGLVTFGDLSLVGVDLDALLDYLYKPDSDLAKSFEFPEPVAAQAGEDKALVGYMIPLEYKPRSNDIAIFMLVRDLMSCCFGGMPRPDEWAYVEMRGDNVAKLFPYVPIVVRGELVVGRLEDEYGFATGVYTVHADSVEAFEPPNPEDRGAASR